MFPQANYHAKVPQKVFINDSRIDPEMHRIIATCQDNQGLLQARIQSGGR